MADVISLKLDNITLDLTNDKYSESFKNVDSLKTSEAGTTLRAVVRTGIPSLSVAYKCDGTEKGKLDTLNRASKLTCKRWNEESGAVVTWHCFMSNYSADLILETATTRFYKVSFKLEDLED